MPRALLLCIGFICLPSALHAQSSPDSLSSLSNSVHTTLGRFLDERDANRAGATSAGDALTHLALNPIPLNHASASRLETLPQVSPLLARRIVQHRTREGPFPDLEGLTAVEGLDQSLLHRLQPYLFVSSQPQAEDRGSNNGDTSTVEKASSPSRSASTDDAPFSSVEATLSTLDVEVLQRATRRLDLGRGYNADSTGATFQGPPGRLTTRIRLQHDQHFQAALTLDKDPGEPLAWRPDTHQYGADHVAGNVALHDIGPLETLVVGNYSAQFGQGVTLWRGLHFGKGRDPVAPLLRSGRGLVPFQSTSEQRFFRGAGATVRVASPVSVTAFYSHRRRDATLHDTSYTTDRRPARTLSPGGAHRTSSERARRSTVGLTTVGGALEYETSTLQLGLTGYRSRFDRSLRPPDQPYRRFALSGHRTSGIGLFGRTVLGNYTVFGEVARSATGAYGGVLGAALNHGDRMQALLLGRNYSRSFVGLYNAGPGESSRTQNEMGLYAGLQLQVAPKWQIAAYVDQYRFPWLRFGVPRSSRGLEARTVVEYDPRPWLSSYVQLKTKRDEDGTDALGPGRRSLAALTTETRQSARWHTEYTFSETVTLRTRFQLSRVTGPDRKPAYGLLLFQGLRLRPFDSLQLDARIALFDTDGYDARLYTYEHDLLYSFSVPALYGDGQRSYALARYTPTASLTLEAKYGVTWYPRRDTLGSGLTAVDGNRRRELRLQIRWTL